MKLWKQIKQWTRFSEAERVQIDRRAFLKGMTVTGAGLLVPGVSLFQMVPGPNYLSMGKVIVPNVPLTTTPLIGFEDLKNRRYASLMAPISRPIDYSSIGRKVFLVEELPKELILGSSSRA